MKKILTEEALLSLLGKFTKQTVSVLGDVGIDRYTLGSVDRISPEAPVPIVLVQSESLKLGLASNVSDNILALGGKALSMGVVGQDDDAKTLSKLFQARGLSSQYLVVDSKRRTILKERIVAETQQMLRVDYESLHPVQTTIRKKVLKHSVAAIKKSSALIIEDYAKGLLDQELISKSIQAARKKGIPVLVDPHLKTPIEWYAGATLLTPNKREAESLAGIKIIDESSLRKAGMTIMKRAQAESLIITLGRDGMAIFKDGTLSPLRIPTFAREVYDVSGAGDTVISVLALAMAGGARLEEAAYLSNLAAGVEVGKRGTATVSPQEIVEAYLIENDHVKITK